MIESALKIFCLVLVHKTVNVKCEWAFSAASKSSKNKNFLPVIINSDKPYYKTACIQVRTRNSSGDEIANVNFLYNDIVHALENTIDSCINSATDRFLQRRFTKFSEITQCNGHYAVHGHSRSPILIPIESSYTNSN